MTHSHDLARAMDHHRHGRLPDAEAGYRAVLTRAPDDPDALHLLGTIIAQRGETSDAIEMIERALRKAPASAEAHFNLANIFAGLLRFTDAERHFREAFRLRPANAEAANGIGGALLRLGRHDAAEEWLNKALELDPHCASALVNMGILMDSTGRFPETIAFYDRILARDPKNAEAHQHRALALLVRGRLAEGWPAYQWRFARMPAFHGRFALPHWRGEPLDGRKILVWTEQGLGDEILAASMIPDLLRMGARIVLICAARLRDLFARSFPAIDIIPRGGQPAHPGVMAELAFQACVSDLGQYLRPSLDAFPSANAYLKADGALTAALRARYRAQAGPNRLVGLSWRSRSQDGGAEKTVPLAAWAPILRTPGVTFVNLQYGDTGAEVAAAERDFSTTIITDPEIDPLGDMMPFASQIAALDLTITVSNTTAHAAGAMGAEAWVLIPSNSGRLWYWFLDRPDSPWYPSLRLIRQQGPDWERTLDDAALRLRAVAAR